MPSLCARWSQNFINLPRWVGQHMISAYLLAGKLSEAGTDSCLWVFIAPFMSLPGALCFNRYPAAVENQANLCSLRCLSSFVWGDGGCFLPRWDWATHLISRALYHGKPAGWNCLFLTAVPPVATRGHCSVCKRREPPASLLTTFVCEQNSFNAKGPGGMKKLAFAANPETGRVVS